MEVTPETITRAIGLLDRNRLYPYVSPTNRNMIRIVEVTYPRGPIKVARVYPKVKGKRRESKLLSISANAIATLASALSKGVPITIDAALYGSSNFRSMLEALVAHTPQCFITYPRVLSGKGSGNRIRRRVKHMIWRDEVAHPPGTIGYCESELAISEPEGCEGMEITVPAEAGSEIVLPADRNLKRHAQIQEALILFGSKLGLPVWIARNDQGISDGISRLGDRDGVLSPAKLADARFLQNREAEDAIAHVDCAWLSRDRYMLEAAFEIEHTTGITSGLTRLLRLWFALPESVRDRVRWTIVAPDSHRDKACQIARREQFRPLDAWFLPYSGVEDFRMLCVRRDLKGASCEFIENFMTKAWES